jgi:glycosyltransferase involved in cell wall biosynthesis
LTAQASKLMGAPKILHVGNYPPPLCGWAIHLKLVVEEMRRRGYTCEILKINENRQIPSSDYVDVQGGFDYFLKLWRYALRGYRLSMHVNAQSKTGYFLALAAMLVGRLSFRPSYLTFHGGLSQMYFPRRDSFKLRNAFWLLFTLAGKITCNSEEIKQEIVQYGIPEGKIAAISAFSSQYLDFQPSSLTAVVENFFQKHEPVICSYVSFRPEYELEKMREAMTLFRRDHPKAGFIWLGFPEKEMPRAEEFVGAWPSEERGSLLLIGNVDHDTFLTLMTRSTIFWRTPACDGVSASVLESLSLGIPVVASDNGRRPAGVVTYRESDAADMSAKLNTVAGNLNEIKASLKQNKSEDKVAEKVDWLVDNPRPIAPGKPLTAN